jgi:hypothetical protein
VVEDGEGMRTLMALRFASLARLASLDTAQGFRAAARGAGEVEAREDGAEADAMLHELMKSW